MRTYILTTLRKAIWHWTAGLAFFIPITACTVLEGAGPAGRQARCMQEFNIDRDGCAEKYQAAPLTARSYVNPKLRIRSKAKRSCFQVMHEGEADC